MAGNRELVRSSSHEIQRKSLFRVATLSVGTIRGRSSEVVKIMSRRSINLCCMWQVGWTAASALLIIGKDNR